MLNKELLEKIKEELAVIIVGAGDIGKYLYQLLKEKYPNNTILICDNSHKKQGKVENYQIYSVEQMVMLFPKGLYLISSSIHEITIKTQLVDLGVSEKNIMLGITVEAQTYLSEKKRTIKFSQLNKIQFEVDITSHCNLNCKCCSQFSSIADEEYIDLEKMKQDFKRLGEIFNGEASRIYLIGGEPLLHPKIKECMKIARAYFQKGKISVFTNGLLLLKQDKGFWDICKENNISIIVTKYPISIDYKKIVEKVKEEKIEIIFFGESEDFKYMTNLGLDIEGKQDINRSFSNCGEANNCIKLKDGKLFTCTRPAAIYKFNKFFGENLEVTEKDYIDIYKEKSKEDILKKLANPIPFCRYCNILGERKAMKWGQTEKKIEEWL